MELIRPGSRWPTAIVVALALVACDGRPSTSGTPVEVVEEGGTKVLISGPEPGSERADALAAIEDGTNFVLYSLQPWAPPAVPGADAKFGTPEYEAYEAAQTAAWEKSQREWCKQEDCLYDNLILGKATLTATADVEAASRNAKLSLGQVPDYAAACVPEYRHALAFKSGGRQFHVMLCYRCGQVAVAIDGDLGRDEQTYEMGSEADLDAILRKANIPLAPKSDS